MHTGIQARMYGRKPGICGLHGTDHRGITGKSAAGTATAAAPPSVPVALPCAVPSAIEDEPEPEAETVVEAWHTLFLRICRMGRTLPCEMMVRATVLCNACVSFIGTSTGCKW